MKASTVVLTLLCLMASSNAAASDLRGPGRFCGYSPIIDLVKGESITTLEGGIHTGSFRWTGPFGHLKVTGIGWARPPKGRLEAKPTSKGHAIFAQRQSEGGYEVAIWNHRNGAAYFWSKQRLTPLQLAAIDRVDLFDEQGPEPTGCKLRTIFVWG